MSDAARAKDQAAYKRKVTGATIAETWAEAFWKDWDSPDSKATLAQTIEAYKDAHAAEQTAGLRAILESEHRANVMLRALPEPDNAWEIHSNQVCDTCTLIKQETTNGRDDRHAGEGAT
jgi:hypothetical protein